MVREIRSPQVPITSVRVGSVPGTHQLIVDGAYEQIVISHEARDRRIFADGALLVKRIVGLAGDRVAIRDGRLLVNGTRVHEPYADPDDIDSEFYGPVRVPVGEVLVLGDNRAESVDSRDFGTVPTTDIEFWPLPDLELIGNERDAT